MPLYLDVHQVPGATAEDLRKAHEADVAIQARYGVDYRKYWLNEKCGKAFCLVEAPNEEAVDHVGIDLDDLFRRKAVRFGVDAAKIPCGCPPAQR